MTGCRDSQLAHFIYGLSNGYKQKVIVTFSAMKAKELYEDLKGFTDDVVMYPAKDVIFSVQMCMEVIYCSRDWNLFRKWWRISPLR